MKPILSISENNILKQVVKVVKKTKKNLFVTMDMANTTLPLVYEKELNRALDRGVMVTRYCFGRKSDYRVLIKKTERYIKHLLVGTSNEFQRFIISDNIKMFFKIDNQFLYTEEKSIIKVFRNYVKLKK